MSDINTADKAGKIKNSEPAKYLNSWLAWYSGGRERRRSPDELNGPATYQTENAVSCDLTFTGFESDFTTPDIFITWCSRGCSTNTNKHCSVNTVQVGFNLKKKSWSLRLGKL